MNSMKYYLAPDSALHSAPYSAPYSKISKISRLVTFWATIHHKINFTQNISHSFFISKNKIVLSIAESFRNIHFLPHFY